MSPPALVADECLQLVERPSDVRIGGRIEAEQGHRLGGHGPQDDVRVDLAITTHLDADVERGEAALDFPAFVFQLNTPSIESHPEIHAALDERPDLGKADTHVAQGQDPADVRELGRRVVAITARRIRPDGAEQPHQVIRPQDLGRDAGESRERADREHRSHFTC